MNQYNVIFLNVQNACSRVKTIEEMLSAALEKLYSKSEEKFVFIIDEWDCIFRSKEVGKEEQTRYLDFLRDLLKDKAYVSLAYMTGILPIKKYGTHSALNMFMCLYKN